MTDGQTSPTTANAEPVEEEPGSPRGGADWSKSASEALGLVGYRGPGADYPRKYVKGPLKDAYERRGYKAPCQEYASTCRSLGAAQNSVIKELLAPGQAAWELLGGECISLRDTYVGERGFIALMPLLDRNTRWRFLDASNNGLRNEAIIHLVDMLLRPQHAGRRLYMNLSRNPISEGAGRALMELVKLHPGVESLDLSMTKIPRRLIERIKRQINHERSMRDPDPQAVEEEPAEVDGDVDGTADAEASQGADAGK